MNLFDVMILDCRKEENKKKLNQILLKIKPIKNKMQKSGYRKTDIVPIDFLESFIQLMYKNKGYCTQWITTCYDETKKFLHYSVGVLDKKRKWIDNVNSKTLWGLYAKVSILMYNDCMKGEEE